MKNLNWFIKNYLSNNAKVLASYENKNYIIVLSNYKTIYVISYYSKFFNKDYHMGHLTKKQAEEKFTSLINLCNRF